MHCNLALLFIKCKRKITIKNVLYAIKPYCIINHFTVDYVATAAFTGNIVFRINLYMHLLSHLLATYIRPLQKNKILQWITFWQSINTYIIYTSHNCQYWSHWGFQLFCIGMRGCLSGCVWINRRENTIDVMQPLVASFIRNQYQ